MCSYEYSTLLYYYYYFTRASQGFILTPALVKSLFTEGHNLR